MDAAAAAGWTAAAIALGSTIVGWARANRTARRAEDQAARALHLAEAAEARAARLELQATEPYDVAWTLRLSNDPHRRGAVEFENTGTTTAHDVTLHVDPEQGERRTNLLSTVHPGERIGLQMPDLATIALQRFDDALDVGALVVPAIALRVRLTWCSAAGVNHRQVWDEIVV